MDKSQKSKVDDLLTFLLLKKIVTPITKSEAFKRGFVDSKGKIINFPEGDDKEYLTLLDKLTFKIKRMLGGKISQLNDFLFIQTLDNDLYNNLVVKGTIEQRAGVKRLKKDVKKLEEKYSLDLDQIIMVMVNEQMREEENDAK